MKTKSRNILIIVLMINTSLFVFLGSQSYLSDVTINLIMVIYIALIAVGLFTLIKEKKEKR